ncbi:MAG: L-threonylcarbamoyladenylate synthase [Nostocoides sp.]
MSPVFDCSDSAGRAEGIRKAADAVRGGSLIVMPTDTLYGVACDAFNRLAVSALLSAKGRGRNMPPPVLVPRVEAVDGLALDVPPYARALMEAFWPGALTLILKAQPSLAWDLGDTNGTVGLRMPDDELALAILADIGPMAVSSANRNGQPNARNILDAATQLGSSVEVYLDAGPVKSAFPSTIVDATGAMPTVLREGIITAAEIDEIAAAHVLPGLDDPSTVDTQDTGDAPADSIEVSATPQEAVTASGYPDALESSPGAPADGSPARDDTLVPDTPSDPIHPDDTTSPEEGIRE